MSVISSSNPFNPFRRRLEAQATGTPSSPTSPSSPSPFAPSVTVTPSATGRTTPPPPTAQNGVRTYEPPSGPPPGTNANGGNRNRTDPIRNDSLLLPDEAPPPYSASADLDETVVELGPRRPFQPAPPQPIPSFRGGPSVSGIASSWARYPGTAGTHVPPPQHPASNSLLSPPSGASHRRASSAYGQRLPGAFPSSSSDIGSSQYTPPSGPPPGRPSSVPPIENERRPTTVATPGRPLLLDGRTLVYPPGHQCYKCHNTGYKSYDPTHPCRKCWARYSKYYTSSLSSQPNFQKPLPPSRGPAQTVSPSQPSAPPPGTFVQRRVVPGSSSQLPPHIGFTRNVPPPGALIVKPGDPRIGGSTCWNCGGDGVVSMFFFDTETCRTCNGIGRVFR